MSALTRSRPDHQYKTSEPGTDHEDHHRRSAEEAVREVDIPMTVGSLMGTISSYTQARPFGCVILALGYDTNDEQYSSKLAPR